MADTLALLGNQVCALFDNDPHAVSAIDGVPIYHGPAGFNEWRQRYGSKPCLGLVAIGGALGKERVEVHEFFESQKIVLSVLVHPTASVASSSEISAGTQILAQALVGSDSIIGKSCIINHRSGVDHECVLGDGCHVAPGATLCGEVRLAANVMVGAGAVVLPRLCVGENTIIGAGAVVTKNVPANSVVVGNPARILDKH